MSRRAVPHLVERDAPAQLQRPLHRRDGAVWRALPARGRRARPARRPRMPPRSFAIRPHALLRLLAAGGRRRPPLATAAISAPWRQARGLTPPRRGANSRRAPKPESTSAMSRGAPGLSGSWRATAIRDRSASARAEGGLHVREDSFLRARGHNRRHESRDVDVGSRPAPARPRSAAPRRCRRSLANHVRFRRRSRDAMPRGGEGTSFFCRRSRSSAGDRYGSGGLPVDPGWGIVGDPCSDTTR